MRDVLGIAAAVLLALGAPALAAAPVTLTVSGDEAKGRIELPGGVAAELEVVFERAVGLHPLALDVTAQLVSPLDLALLARLPAGGSVVPPAAFPVLLRIEPSETSALSFAGIVTVELHTENLAFRTNSPLALFAGPVGGPLVDITRQVGLGSYRAGGSRGGFSDFMIVADTRAIDTVIHEKFERVQAALSQYGERLPAAVLADLQVRLDNARALYLAGATLAAKAEVNAFAEHVQAQSGAAIPDVWRAHDDVHVNVAGLLRAGAETLRFSLDKKATYP